MNNPGSHDDSNADNPDYIRPFTLTPGRRLCMVLIGYIPFLNVLLIVGWLALVVCMNWPLVYLWAALVWLLIVPPVVVRVTGMIWPQVDGVYPLGSTEFLCWWFVSQWQTIFNRMPMIEEALRLVPGLYSTWLRLWGARVGGLVYWTPGIRIFDRSWVDIGSRVNFGVGVLIAPHILLPDKTGALVLKIGAVRIGDDTLVGGESVLSCGVTIGPRQITPARKAFRPFSGWHEGKHVRPRGKTHQDADLPDPSDQPDEPKEGRHD